MKFTNRKSAGVLALMMAGAMASSVVCAQAADLSVRFAWYIQPDTATARQDNAIAKNIEQDSGGKIAVKTYPSGSLATESTMAQALTNNTANMGVMAMHWWSSQEPALEWDTIPFLTSDAGKLLTALHGKLGDDINKILEKHGVKIIGWGFYGYAESYLNNVRPIKVPTDLKGLKMRSEGKLNSTFLQRTGATPVAIDAGEVYTALQRGTLDGATSGMPTIASRKWYEAGKYITAIHYIPILYPVYANLNWWKGLTDGQRKIISGAIAKTEKTTVEAVEADFTNDIAIAKKAGVKVYRPTSEDLAKWKDATYAMTLKAYLAQSGAEGKLLLSDLEKSLGISVKEASK